MSPIGQSPGGQEGATGDRNGVCAYNQVLQQEQTKEHILSGSTNTQRDQSTTPSYRCNDAHKDDQKFVRLGSKVK